jgi:Tfp pilus assembly protein PilZ
MGGGMKQNNLQNQNTRKERRKAVRVEVDKMNMLFKGAEISNISGRVHDISMGGMFIETYETQDIGANIQADIDAESLGLIVWVRGRVTHANRLGIGIQFTELDDIGIDTLMHLRRRMV